MQMQGDSSQRPGEHCCIKLLPCCTALSLRWVWTRCAGLSAGQAPEFPDALSLVMLITLGSCIMIQRPFCQSDNHWTKTGGSVVNLVVIRKASCLPRMIAHQRFVLGEGYS
jgi:hypothetical protein